MAHVSPFKDNEIHTWSYAKQNLIVSWDSSVDIGTRYGLHRPIYLMMRWDSSVDIGTRYGLHRPIYFMMSWDSSVDIGTRYGLHRPIYFTLDFIIQNDL
jgi:hypothetical protein